MIGGWLLNGLVDFDELVLIQLHVLFSQSLRNATIAIFQVAVGGRAVFKLGCC